MIHLATWIIQFTIAIENICWLRSGQVIQFMNVTTYSVFLFQMFSMLVFCFSFKIVYITCFILYIVIQVFDSAAKNGILLSI